MCNLARVSACACTVYFNRLFTPCCLSRLAAPTPLKELKNTHAHCCNCYCWCYGKSPSALAARVHAGCWLGGAMLHAGMILKGGCHWTEPRKRCCLLPTRPKSAHCMGYLHCTHAHTSMQQLAPVYNTTGSFQDSLVVYKALCLQWNDSSCCTSVGTPI